MNEPNQPTSEPVKHASEPVAPAATPPLRVGEPRHWTITAGEWLQRPPSKHMGLITTLIVVIVMFLLVVLFH